MDEHTISLNLALDFLSQTNRVVDSHPEASVANRHDDVRQPPFRLNLPSVVLEPFRKFNLEVDHG